MQRPDHRLSFKPFFIRGMVVVFLSFASWCNYALYGQQRITHSVDFSSYQSKSVEGLNTHGILLFPQSEITIFNKVALVSTSLPIAKGKRAKIIDFKPYFNTQLPLDLPYREGLRNVEPILETQKGRVENRIEITFLPGRWTSLTQFQLLDSIQFVLEVEDWPETRSNPPKFAEHSILQTIPTYKFRSADAGIYRIDNQFMADLGINTSGIDPSKIKIFTTNPGPLPEKNNLPRTDDLAEVAIQVIGGDDGKWDASDYILFYSPGPHRWNKESDSTFTRVTNIYEDYKYFFIQVEGAPGKRIVLKDGGQAFDVESDIYDHIEHYEVDKVNLLREYAKIGGGQLWLDELITGSNRTKDLSGLLKVDNLVAGETGYVKMAFAVRSKSRSVISMIADNQAAEIQFETTRIEDSESRVASYNSKKSAFTQAGGPLKISFDFPQVATESLGWMDYVEVNIKRYLSKPQSAMAFRLSNPGITGNIRYNLTGLSSTDAVWDISDLFNVTQCKISPTGGSGSIVAPYPQQREFICFGTNDIKTPEKIGLVTPQDIHGMATPDMVIIYHAKFAEEARNYANHRSSISGIDVAIVDVDHIRNEFSGGGQDPTGIRDMARMFYYRNPEKFRYILLLGDGSYDYRGLTFNATSKKENSNYVPVYEFPRAILEPIRSIPSDDYFGMLDEEDGEIEKGTIDVYVGRFPVYDKSQAQSIINKIISYEKNKDSFGDWRNYLMLISDDWDNVNSDDFIVQSEKIFNKIQSSNPGINFSKIYLDIFKQESNLGGQSYPTAVSQMNDQYNKGVLIANYVGHGGVDGLAQERIIDRLTLNGMKNSNRLPLLITGTCSFATYDDPDITSVGKLCITKPDAGMIGLMTTTRSVYITPNEVFINKLFQVIYQKENGRYLTNGEILAKAKNLSSGADRLAFVLLGDPAMTLAFPRENILLETVNGAPIDTAKPDTIKAMELVSLAGSVRAEDGRVIEDFNGTLTLTVFDKAYTLYSRGNDGNGANYPASFQNNILFKGKATVTAGKWNISFYLPKDINYAIDYGKLSFYADNGIYDAGGYSHQVKIGGESSNPITDNQPPVIDLYMNTLNFKSGETVNTTPLFIARLSDDYGINVSSSSIGHEIVSTLNNDATKEKIMNDFYVADKDEYNKGEVRYQFDQLDPGNYTLRLRAWDISNNKAEAEIEFIVTNSEQNSISHLLNYPNPFTTSTAFMFEFDSQNNTIEAEIAIYSVSGKLVKTIREPLSPSGKRFRSDLWDGKDQYGDQLAKGVYLYKVKIYNSFDTAKKVISSDFQKLVILK